MPESQYWSPDNLYWNAEEKDGHEPTQTEKATSQGTTPVKKAVQRLIRGADGRLHVAYIDLSNFQYVRDPLAEGFQVVNPGNTDVEVTTDGTPDGDVVSIEKTRPGEDVVTPTETGHIVGQVTENPMSANVPAASGTIGTPNEINRYNEAVRTGIQQGAISPSFASQGTVGTSNPVGVATPATASATEVTPGLGLANLAGPAGNAVTKGLAGFRENYGINRPNRPNESLIDNVRTSVGNVFGKDATVVGTSGMGEYGSHRHRRGNALDFDVEVDGQRVTNNQAMRDLAMDFAARNPTAGIGYGKGYMTHQGQPGRMHLDMANDPASWGKDGSSANDDPNDLGYSGTDIGNIDFARQTGIGPSPTFGAPTPSPNPGPAVAHNSQFDLSSQTSPASLAAQGFTKRTDREIGLIAKTLAGEMSPRSLNALAAGDPKAERELANMITSIENRAASTRFGSLEDALTGSQYNSNLPANTATTLGNFGKFQGVMTNKVKSYFTPDDYQIKPDNYDITHYYNPDIAQPDWGSQMQNPVDAGEHRFGTLSDITPGNAFNSERDRLSRAQISDTRGFTPDLSADRGSSFAPGDSGVRGTGGFAPGGNYSGGSSNSGRAAGSSSGSPGGGRAGGVGRSGVGGGFSNSGGFAPGGSNTSHPGSSQGHGYSPGGAGGHTGGQSNDRGGFAGL